MRALLILALLAACAPKVPPSASVIAKELGFGTTPRLTPSVSASYMVVPARLTDPVIAPLLRGRTADGALTGAASGLALAIAGNKGGMARWELREALWRAGWAFPVYDARAWTTSVSGPPPQELFAWVDALAEDEPFALARARGRDQDAWVALRARPPFALGPVPRLANVGTPVSLPALPGATWRAADGSGLVQSGSLDAGATLLLGTAGEWILDVRANDRELARFPIYVGISGPTEPALRLPEPFPVSSEEDAHALAVALLDAVRTTYGLPTWKGNPILDQALQRYLANPEAGSAAALDSLGFPAAEAIAWACDDTTVENCIDTWIWDVRRRAALLSPAIDGYGLQVAMDSSGVHMALLLADTQP